MNEDEILLRRQWQRLWKETCSWHMPEGVAVIGVEYIYDMNRELNDATN